jgi:hypothetical protein
LAKRPVQFCVKSSYVAKPVRSLTKIYFGDYAVNQGLTAKMLEELLGNRRFAVATSGGDK